MKHTGKGLYGLLIIAILSLAILAGCGGGGGGDDSTASGDTTAPTNTTASNFINSGASSTNSTTATLAISATDSVGVTGYYPSETSTAPSASATGWTSVTSTTSYSASVSFTLSSGDGEKTVYVWFKDAAGNVSAATNDTITLSAPTASDFVGTWNGAMTLVRTDGENETYTITLAFALSNGSLTGTYTDSDGTFNITGTSVTNGTLSFTVPTKGAPSGDDCGNWNVAATATLDSSLTTMNTTLSGTFCSASGGVTGTSTGTLTKQ